MAIASECLSLTAVYEPVEEGWIQARLVELPEVMTAGPNADAAKELLLDALRQYLLSLADDTDPLPMVEGSVRGTIELRLTG